MAIPKNVKEEFKALQNACDKFVDSKLILIEKSIDHRRWVYFYNQIFLHW